MRKAVDELAAENLLVRRQGKGTFVATHLSRARSSAFCVSFRDEGEPAPPQSRFLECRRVRASADIARLLELRSGDAVVNLRRLLSFGADPIVLEEIWLPGAQFKGLTAERLAEYKGPLYGLFESEFGMRMIRAEEKLRAVGAERGVAELLGVAEGAPLLLVERALLLVRRTAGRSASRPVRARHTTLSQHADLTWTGAPIRSEYRVSTGRKHHNNDELSSLYRQDPP